MKKLQTNPCSQNQLMGSIFCPHKHEKSLINILNCAQPKKHKEKGKKNHNHSPKFTPEWLFHSKLKCQALNQLSTAQSCMVKNWNFLEKNCICKISSLQSRRLLHPSSLTLKITSYSSCTTQQNWYRKQVTNFLSIYAKRTPSKEIISHKTSRSVPKSKMV